MKKFIAMLLALALVTPFSLGCGDKTKKETKKVEEKNVDSDPAKEEVTTETKTTVDETPDNGDKEDK